MGATVSSVSGAKVPVAPPDAFRAAWFDSPRYGLFAGGGGGDRERRTARDPRGPCSLILFLLLFAPGFLVPARSRVLDSCLMQGRRGGSTTP